MIPAETLVAWFTEPLRGFVRTGSPVLEGHQVFAEMGLQVVGNRGDIPVPGQFLRQRGHPRHR